MKKDYSVMKTIFYTVLFAILIGFANEIKAQMQPIPNDTLAAWKTASRKRSINISDYTNTQTAKALYRIGDPAERYAGYSAVDLLAIIARMDSTNTANNSNVIEYLDSINKFNHIVTYSISTTSTNTAAYIINSSIGTYTANQYTISIPNGEYELIQCVMTSSNNSRYAFNVFTGTLTGQSDNSTIVNTADKFSYLSGTVFFNSYNLASNPYYWYNGDIATTSGGSISQFTKQLRYFKVTNGYINIQPFCYAAVTTVAQTYTIYFYLRRIR